jgi:catechol 2,3-dioxygenase-like lactoylglutathione lyase family enzyme
MIDHVGFDVRDFPASTRFYEKALAPLGVKLLIYKEEWNAAGFGTDRPRFWLGAGKPMQGEDEVHLCFSANSRTEVDAFYREAIAAGGRDNGPPGLRPIYHPNYYGAFVFDLDGHGIEACCHLPE